MKSRRLKRAALFAGLAGFVWSLVAIDPVVRSGRHDGNFSASDDNPSCNADHPAVDPIVASR